jgi:casein kinase II subunit alpha
LFYGADNADQLVVIAKVLGTDDLFQYLNKYDIELDRLFDDILGRYPRKPWSSFVTKENERFATPEAIDFLNHLLVYDHQLRFTPREAMRHHLFDVLRKPQ